MINPPAWEPPCTAVRWALDGAVLPTVGAAEIDVEAVAALDPDLIVGVYSFMDEGTYELLSGIAPVVAQPAE